MFGSLLCRVKTKSSCPLFLFNNGSVIQVTSTQHAVVSQRLSRNLDQMTKEIRVCVTAGLFPSVHLYKHTALPSTVV